MRTTVGPMRKDTIVLRLAYSDGGVGEQRSGASAGRRRRRPGRRGAWTSSHSTSDPTVRDAKACQRSAPYVHAGEVRCEEFLYELKAGPAGGRLRRPSSRRQRHDGHPGVGLTEHSSRSHRFHVEMLLASGHALVAGCLTIVGGPQAIGGGRWKEPSNPITTTMSTPSGTKSRISMPTTTRRRSESHSTVPRSSASSAASPGSRWQACSGQSV